MDTLLKTKFTIPCRTCEYLITVSLIFTLVLSHGIFQSPIYANDLIANTVISSPNLRQGIINLTKEEEYSRIKSEFDNRIGVKYQNNIITEVDSGIKHIKMIRYYAGKPVKINIVEMNEQIAQNYEVKPATASTNTLHHRTTLRTIAGRTNSIVAINGGFFKPQTGVPLGTLMINGKIYTGPVYNRVAMGIFENGYKTGRLEFKGKISGNGEEIRIDNLNQPRMLSSYVLAYSRDWGTYAPASPRYGVQLQIRGNKITAASANPLFIPEDGYVLVGPKSELGKLFGAENITLELGMIPEWQGVKHIISGGPYLVKNGEVFVDIAEEKLLAIGGRNPRTAIGYTKDNNLIFVVVDGREGSSIGMTLTELAYLMKSLGCVNAINLDGGGSTVMYVNGQIVNHPQQIGGIALSNALVISKK